MKYAENYIRSSIAIIDLYKGDIPLAVFLKDYFSANKKFGSKDRRYITEICYSYYRTGQSLIDVEINEALKIALYLCNNEPGVWQSLFSEEWLKNWFLLVKERIVFVEQHQSKFQANTIFPFIHLLSKGIDATNFTLAHLTQPDLFIRIRPGRKVAVDKAFKEANILYTPISETCYALANGTKLDGVGEVDKDFVVQDYSSQRVGELIQTVDRGRWTVGGNKTSNSNELRSTVYGLPSIWDCCAASGGKSILAKDILGNIDLTVSDVRASILHNLEQRFKRAGITNYKKFVADLSSTVNGLPSTVHGLRASREMRESTVHLLLCDAPCTGSGTWARTPEQLYFFKEKKVQEFQLLQQKIVRNSIKALQPGGYLLYITCSVFEAENEAMLAFVETNSTLKLVEQKVLEGHAQKADTMYAALFQLGI